MQFFNVVIIAVIIVAMTLPFMVGCCSGNSNTDQPLLGPDGLRVLLSVNRLPLTDISDQLGTTRWHIVRLRYNGQIHVFLQGYDGSNQTMVRITSHEEGETD